MADQDDKSGKASALRPHPTEYEIVHRERVLDMFFKVDQVTVKHQQFDGTMSKARPWLVFERGDAAAALLFDPATREVILIDQFRVPTLGKTSHRGWLHETVAGMIPAGKETPEQCIIREIEEEVGYRVTELVPIASFFSSPGGTSERIFLFFAEVSDTQKIAQGGGVDDGEDIQTVRMPLGEFMRRLSAREFEDPKIIIAGQWLRERRQAQARDTGVLSPASWYRLAKSPGKQIGFLTGDIADVKGHAQVWVNSENTDMMMDRFFDRSVSATIRFLGAEKYPNRRVKEDLIADALARLMRDRKFVRPATVLDTTAGELEETHGVKRIFHVAAVEGIQGEGQRTDISTLEACVDAVLDEISRARAKYTSVLFPMLGTGKGGFQVRAVAPLLVARAMAFLEANPATPIERILLLGYTTWDGDVIAEELQKLVDKSRLSQA